jgi:hypothetical protein
MSGRAPVEGERDRMAVESRLHRFVASRRGGG